MVFVKNLITKTPATADVFCVLFHFFPTMRAVFGRLILMEPQQSAAVGAFHEKIKQDQRRLNALLRRAVHGNVIRRE